MLARIRTSTIIFLLALGVALWALYALDRALAQRDRAELDVEARESAALAEGFLAAHAQALQAIRALHVDAGHVVTEAQFNIVASALYTYAPALRRIWDTDSAGVIAHQFVFDSSAAPLPQIDIDTTTLLGLNRLAAKARVTHRTELSAPGLLPSGVVGIVMIEPIFVGDQFNGFAGATIISQAILSHVQRRRNQHAHELKLVADGELVATLSAPAGLGQLTRDSAEVRTPGNDRWWIVVGHSAQDRRTRMLLWGSGLVALAALFTALFRELRQNARLAERSAELERLSTELLRANRAKSEFLANVSHELRTPLNAIVGFVDLLRDGVYGELAQRQVSPVGRIASSANHLRHLVDQVLDIAKMAAGRLEVQTESVDLRAFVLNVASELELLVSDRGLNLSLAVSRTLPRVRTDPTHLRQILLNLLGNAVKYTTSGGIAVRTRLVEDPSEMLSAPPPRVDTVSSRSMSGKPLWIALQVADTGIGIARQDLGRIFEEFEQVNAGGRGDSMMRGTGLGLAISRRLARLLGGDITVESEVGKGSTFTLWLAVDQADVLAAEAPAVGAMLPSESDAAQRRGASPEDQNTRLASSSHHPTAAPGSEITRE